MGALDVGDRVWQLRPEHAVDDHHALIVQGIRVRQVGKYDHRAPGAHHRLDLHRHTQGGHPGGQVGDHQVGGFQAGPVDHLDPPGHRRVVFDRGPPGFGRPIDVVAHHPQVEIDPLADLVKLRAVLGLVNRSGQVGDLGHRCPPCLVAAGHIGRSAVRTAQPPRLLRPPRSARC